MNNKKMYVWGGLCLAILMAACRTQSDVSVISEASTPETETSSAPVVKSAGETLMADSDCRGCHAVDTKVIGPSYLDIAKKYENNTKNIETLAKKVMDGGQGNWGEIPMTAHPDLKMDDAKAIVKYILTMKP